MKIIKVNHCWHCPYSSDCGRYCESMDDRLIETDGIPDWCPLPDMEDENGN